MEGELDQRRSMKACGKEREGIRRQVRDWYRHTGGPADTQCLLAAPEFAMSVLANCVTDRRSDGLIHGAETGLRMDGHR